VKRAEGKGVALLPARIREQLDDLQLADLV
jgi:hypothetical protein